MLIWKNLILPVAIVGASSFALCPLALSQEPSAHFAKLALADQVTVINLDSTEEAAHIVPGETGGSFSLTALSRYDDAGNLCSGYSYDSKLPNHILEVSSPVEALSIWVDSGGEDTTLLIRGNDRLVCGDDLSLLNSDAGVTVENWEPGLYQIWVGSSVPGHNHRYQLQVEREELSPE